MASLRRRRTEKARRAWREDIVRHNRGRKTFRIPDEGARPRIRGGLKKAPKGFYQLASGRAVAAPFLEERFGWIASNTC